MKRAKKKVTSKPIKDPKIETVVTKETTSTVEVDRDALIDIIKSWMESRNPAFAFDKAEVEIYSHDDRLELDDDDFHKIQVKFVSTTKETPA